LLQALFTLIFNDQPEIG